MNTNPERGGTQPLAGNLLRLDDRHEVAIYLRDGAAWIAEFNDGRGVLHIAGEWFSTGQGRSLAHAQRRGEVEIISPIPDEVVERIKILHQRTTPTSHSPLTSLSRLAERLVAGVRGFSRGRMGAEYIIASNRRNASIR